MHCIILLLILRLCYTYSTIQNVCENEDSAIMINYIKSFGYPVEVHTVVTEDKYILNTFRIPHGRNTSKFNETVTGKPVVFLMHSMIGTTYEFVAGGPERSLGFMLADRGYDVWIANHRGNLISKGHMFLNSTTDKKYWHYSWHELGVYDLPANFVYISDVTGRNNMDYVGMSQGSTVFFVMCAERPEYNKYIRQMVAMGPTAYLGHNRSPAKFIKDNLDFMKWLASIIGLDELLPKDINNLLRYLLKTFCGAGNIMQETCIQIMFFATGVDLPQLDTASIPKFLRFALGGFSIRQVFHYAQLMKSGNFEQYDFGKRINQLKYHSDKPPPYDLSRANVSIALFYGEDDVFTDIRDLSRLQNELPNASLYKVPLKTFSHVDFISATDIVELVYNKIFELFAQ